jgi:hypothetical protein
MIALDVVASAIECLHPTTVFQETSVSFTTAHCQVRQNYDSSAVLAVFYTDYRQGHYLQLLRDEQVKRISHWRDITDPKEGLGELCQPDEEASQVHGEGSVGHSKDQRSVLVGHDVNCQDQVLTSRQVGEA